uniref:Sperm-associated antigen 5 n=1 Tax=Echeneis naucrates TaxID=173247 RepID=A0A665XCP2_ECHNA
MSSRKSRSVAEGLLSSKHGERTPLRSLENETLHLSTPTSILKSSANTLKIAMGDAPLNDAEPSLHYPPTAEVTQTSAPMNEMATAEATCRRGDITFESFVCPGGEVEISSSSGCINGSIILPDNEATHNTETEDTVISVSMIVQSCGHSIEHLYYNPEMTDTSVSIDLDASGCSEVPKTATASKNLDDRPPKKNSDTDVTRQNDETIPLSHLQLHESLHDNTLNSTNDPDYGQMCQAGHTEHPCCSGANGAPVITPDGFEKPCNGLSDITFKSFNCTGGEIQISDDKLENEAIFLPVNNTVTASISYNASINLSISAGDHDVQSSKEHLDHPYCNNQNCSLASDGNLSAAQEALQRSTDAMGEVKQISFEVSDNQTGRQEAEAFALIGVGLKKSNGTRSFEKSFPLPDIQAVICQPPDDNTRVTSITQHQINYDYEHQNCVLGNEAVLDTHQPVCIGSLLTNLSLENKSINGQVQETSNHSLHPEDSLQATMHHKTRSSDCSDYVASAESCPPVEVEQHLEHVTQMHSNSGLTESSKAKDSALVSSANGPVLCNSAENLSGILKALSECPSVASALQFGILSPVARRASLSASKGHNEPGLDHFLSEDSALEAEKSLVAPDPARLWAEHLDSPMSRPLFNSTALGFKPQSDPVTESDTDVKPFYFPQSEVGKPVLDFPLIPDGPLQQQLRQMAEFLILASGKMGPPAAASASVPIPAVISVPLTRTTPVESHSACVGTSAVKLVDHSLNTSGQFERKRDFSVVDSCTLTDPLLWNVPPGSLECLPKQELEQRLRSSMIMVEVLVQQLAAARAHGCPAGPAPSELREKFVQTDHTELNQTTMHRGLYMEALSRINELELDETSLRNLIQCLQDTWVTMTSLTSDTDAALSNMKETEDIVREDLERLVSHYGQVKSVFERTKETQTRMIQKVKDALQQTEDMRAQMMEALAAKQMAFSAMDQLRTHCAKEISELEKSVGSQQDLLAALNQVYPEQVALNHASNETLNYASELLSHTMDEQTSLMKEIEEELNRANLNLQTARQQTGDLNLQVTILTSEMGVLRQKLTEKEEDSGQLERKITELSATVSSTLASYTFLEQALASETTKLQQSWKDIQQAKDRANELEISLGQSDERICELSQDLAESEDRCRQLQILSQSQKIQIQQLQDVCTQLSGVREMNEFLQMENELAREQVAESERLLSANLQGLRERNIQCEDIKTELCLLQHENRNLQEQLETERSNTSATRLELGEKLAQAVTDITLQHHTLRGLTNELHAALTDQKAEPQKDKESQQIHNLDCRHFSSSFVDSIMVALTAELEEDTTHTLSEPVPEIPEPQHGTLFSETSAFTRFPAVTPNTTSITVEPELDEDDQCNVTELLSDLGSTVTELASTIKLLQQRKDAQLEELHNTICGLQEEQQAADSKHEAEVLELKHQLSRLNSLVERGNQALQQKAQDERTMATLSAEIQDAQETLNKHKADNNELRKEVAELRRSLQQFKVESDFLRKEFRKAGSPSADAAHFMEDNIQLLREVERLKLSLQEVEQARVKLLERAKRHQMIHQSNQQKSENELQMLNNMINKVRETLLSLPEILKNCEQLQQLVEYIG